MTQTRFPAVDRLQAQLRADLCVPPAQTRTRGPGDGGGCWWWWQSPSCWPRRRVWPPPGMFDSPDVAYECPEAQQLNARDAVASAPAEDPRRPERVAPEPERQAPENPC